jgi:serine/threonine protein kinase
MFDTVNSRFRLDGQPSVATPSVDMWSAGVTLYEMLCNERLFHRGECTAGPLCKYARIAGVLSAAGIKIFIKKLVKK